jgi:hypothetical protein
MTASSKADALNRGRSTRGMGGSAVPLPPPDREGPDHEPRSPAAGRAPAGQGRRGHLRKVSLELTPEDHDRLKLWIIGTFGGGTAAAPVLRALLAEAQHDPALTERVRRRMEQSRD